MIDTNPKKIDNLYRSRSYRLRTSSWTCNKFSSASPVSKIRTSNNLLSRRFHRSNWRHYWKIKYQKREKIVIATKLLANPKTDKKLMSKSEGNFIALNDSSKEMFGKTMALPDEVIIPCFELCTELSLQQIQQIEKELKAKKEFDNIFIEHKVAEINPLKQGLKHQTF